VLHEHGRVDVLFVGSSIVRTNISPLLFDGAVRRATGADVVSFNGGLSGLWPRGVSLYLSHLWLPTVTPRVVIQGIRASELRQSELSVHPGFATSTAERGWLAGRWTDDVEWSLMRRLRLLQHRGSVWERLQRFRDGYRGAMSDEPPWQIDARGYTVREPPLPVLRARGVLREPPYSTVCGQRDCAVAFDALREVHRTCLAAGIDYVLVNVPEHAFRWSRPNGQALYAEYLAKLRDFARRERITFVDVTRGDPSTFGADAEFSDYHHMGPGGAEHLTRLLAAELIATGRPAFDRARHASARR
jgi:hypothetical protein